ncbi:magnesium chelatase subunit D family protein [Kineosporia sp. J2-2]|uniref:Mg-protoporphyrin IX chelatase n=1 Tax=Kineosporia corallincola TaxID=2835133 RepID=A0ABS5TE92_9ACTN|nr:magnesium chelatase subunit D family protein [Kineosporia corallincola]MBT0769356.1 magnesium chelatase subunit D family protein [Kineosporia corallincola]
MDDLVLSLLLSSVAPDIGGVLVRGEKGTAKSTAVRALANLLPSVDVISGCRFGCDPHAPDPQCPDQPHGHEHHPRPARLVELPVGATEDRLLGSLDLDRALSSGVRAYEPGLLAAAHRGILYVDEVNLLHDHLVDVLLDAAAMGRVHIERESISITHAARFVLVGTMNPEEGELRPQLLDRFGLTVEVRASRDPDVRAEVVRRRLAFDADPEGFVKEWQEAERELAARITSAREHLGSVELSDGVLRQIAAVCAAFDVDGMRADLVVARTARAHAAWSGRGTVTSEDVRVAAMFALPHRRRRDPFDAPGMDENLLDEALRDNAPDETEPPETDPDGGPDEGPEGGPEGGPGGQDPQNGPDQGDKPGGEPGGEAADRSGGPDRAEAPGQAAPQPSVPRDAAQAKSRPQEQESSRDDELRAPAPTQDAVSATNPFKVKSFKVPGLGKGTAGRRSRALTESGRTIATMPLGSGQTRGGRSGRVHLPATLTAAAAQQHARGREPGGPVLLRSDDIRLGVREGREGNLILFCVDASGSMAAKKRMAAVKGAVLSLLLDAYQRRDRVGLITFRGQEADLALPPTGAVEAARMRLDRLPTGGRTPLSAGLRRAWAVIGNERLRDPHRRPLLVLVTDGRHTAGEDPTRIAAEFARRGVRSVVVDCERGPVRLGMAGKLAAGLGGELITLDDLRAESLAGMVRGQVSQISERRVA